MSYKEIIKTNLNKFPNLSYLDRNDPPIYNDLFSEDYILGIKINKENSDNKINPKEEKIEILSDKISNKEKKITNFNFTIINRKNPLNLNFDNFPKEKIESKSNKEVKKRGRKRKRNDKKEKENYEIIQDKITHDRYSDDNIRKKCKNLVLKNALEFINKKIKEKYNNNIGKGSYKKQLKILNQDDKVNSTINIEKSFLTKTLKEIFSEKISARFSHFPPEHNKLLIESLIKEKDEEKKQYFIKLFNISFLDCLNRFRGEKIGINELDGFRDILSIKETLIEEYGEEYVDLLIYYLKNFKEIIDNKKARNKNKSKNEINVK